MSALVQNRSIRNDTTPIDLKREAGSKPGRLNMVRCQERSILIIDGRSLDGQSLASSISASKTDMEAVWASSISECRRKQLPRQRAAILMNIGGKNITDPAVASEIGAVHLRPDNCSFDGRRLLRAGEQCIDAGIADAVLTAKLRDRRARLVLLQNADNLFVCETAALHSLVLSIGQS
jgi:hypothetical protein